MLRYFKLWVSIGYLMVLAVLYLSLAPAPPEISIEFEYIDKLEHFLAYFILMFWFAQLYKTSRVRLFYVFFFVVMGITLEILQGLGGIRFFEYSDMLANSFGVFIAYFITKSKLSDVLFFFENKLLK